MNIENVSLTEELILKASECKTSEELVALAYENGITITPEQLPELMAEIAKKCSGELSDDALEMEGAVGGKAKFVTPGHSCEYHLCSSCGVSLYMLEHGNNHSFNCRALGTPSCANCRRRYTKNLLNYCGR